MKASLWTVTAILTISVAAGWHVDRRMNEARKTRDLQLKEAAVLGIQVQASLLPSTGESSSAPTPSTQPEETAAPKEVRELSADFLILMREVDEGRRQGRNQDDDLKRKIASHLERLVAMSPEQLKSMVALTLADTSLEENLRLDLVQSFLMQLAKTGPAEALGILRQSHGKLTGNSRTRSVVSIALGNWSRQDPRAAADWLEAARTDFPDLCDGRAANSIAASAATTDPALAVELAGRLKIQDRPQLVAEIAAAAGTPQARSAALSAVRAFVADSGSAGDQSQLLEAAMPRLATGAAKDGFTACAVWLETANLEEREAAAFVSGIPLGSEEGQWIDWTGNHLPSAQADSIIAKRVTKWTTADHRAAGEWLNALPPGSAVRETAISAFAATVARYEPEAAERWALTLPEGPRRQETFRQIQANWPSGSPAADEAAKAFAQRHELP